MERMLTKKVMCGSVAIGGGSPISIQSMTNTDTRDVEATASQIERLCRAGCQIVRLAIPDEEAAQAFYEIKKRCPIPMVADIHFDYRLAIMAIENGADKIRINPGNIGSNERVKAVLDKAKAFGIPVRIGVNSGSLERELLEKHGGVTAMALCESAINAVEYANSLGFEDLVVSLKSSDVAMNHMAHKLFRERSDRPLHAGLTEAGVGHMAEIKSTAALGALLLEGIGDTMRISLTGDPVREVILAKELLTATGIRRYGIDFVSCPTCGRTRVNLPEIAATIEKELEPLAMELEANKRFLRVAVMGCEVNGPGEAKHADLGVACGKGIGLLMENGSPVRTVPEQDIIPALVSMIRAKVDL